MTPRRYLIVPLVRRGICAATVGGATFLVLAGASAAWGAPVVTPTRVYVTTLGAASVTPFNVQGPTI